MAASRQVRAEILVRWDQPQVPAPAALGVSALVIPATQTDAIDDAASKGYRIYVELEAGKLAGFRPPAAARGGVFVKGASTPAQRQSLEQRINVPGARVFALEERGKWPHVRLDWVTRRNGVLQVSSRTAQPWIQSNGALFRVAEFEHDGAQHMQRVQPVQPVLTYRWTPITIADEDAGPSLDDYLVAIAEAGSVGASLVLPLHPTFQQALLSGRPDARAQWQTMRRYLEFYAWDLPRQYRAVANIGVVANDPMAAFEVLNLLTRHNLPFRLIRPEALTAETLDGLALLIAPDAVAAPHLALLADFASAGHTLVTMAPVADAPWRAQSPLQETADQASFTVGEGVVVERRLPAADPNAFALQVRELLGRERRVMDIWNGITVIATLRQDEGDGTMLLSVVNYAHDGRPVQLRVRGSMTTVQYESPEQEATLLPYTHRQGFTEFVLPEVRVGGRVFLSGEARSR